MEVGGTSLCLCRRVVEAEIRLESSLLPTDQTFFLQTHRIEGGIGLVLKWWPIKAYRPCPNFIENGGFYQRSGQGLDEIAFGRDSTFDVDK